MEPTDLPNRPSPPGDQASLVSAEEYWSELEELGRALLSQLDYFEALGLTALPRNLAPPPARSRPEPPGPVQAQRPSPRSVVSEKRPVLVSTRVDQAAPAEKAANLDELGGLIVSCQACPLAAKRQAPPSPGRGGANPILWLVGPDPSVFAPEAWDLLTAMMEKGLELGPEDYYVSTLVRCLPPPGTRPGDQDDRLCRPFLDRELELLNPRVVLALGRIPAQRLSGSRDQLRLLRTRSFPLPGPHKRWLRVTYGLEDILDSKALKLEAWKDLKQIKPGLSKLKTERM